MNSNLHLPVSILCRSRRTRVKLVLVLLVTGTLQAMSAHAQSHGIVGQPAPSLSVQDWINLPEGTSSIDVHDLKGKVVYLYCFQSWCPGCHTSGFPTLKAVYDRFNDDDDVAFLLVQTTFEGEHVNTFARAKEVAKEYDLTIPLGQSGGEGRRSPLMNSYRTRGTPWTILVDRNGIVRFNDFHITPKNATALMMSLKAEHPTPERE